MPEPWLPGGRNPAAGRCRLAGPGAAGSARRGRRRFAGRREARQCVEELAQLLRVIGFPTGDTRFGVLGNLPQQVNAAEQQVNFALAEFEFPLLGQREAIFHGMGHAHGGLKIDDAGRSLQGMGGAHEHLQLPGRCRAALEFQQAAGQNGRLVLRFHAEELQHRQIAHVIGFALVHVRLRLRDENKRSASRKPTVLPCQGRRP